MSRTRCKREKQRKRCTQKFVVAPPNAIFWVGMQFRNRISICVSMCLPTSVLNGQQLPFLLPVPLDFQWREKYTYEDRKKVLQKFTPDMCDCPHSLVGVQLGVTSISHMDFSIQFCHTSVYICMCLWVWEKNKKLTYTAYPLSLIHFCKISQKYTKKINNLWPYWLLRHDVILPS